MVFAFYDNKSANVVTRMRIYGQIMNRREEGGSAEVIENIDRFVVQETC